MRDDGYIWYQTKDGRKCHFPMYPPPGRRGNCKRCGECCAAIGCKHLMGKDCSIRNDLLDSYKGCLIWPSKPEEIAPFPNCGYRFEAVT